MDTQQKAQKIVIIEDNADLAEIYKARLELIGYQCFVATDGIAGLYHVQSEKPDLVLLDLMVPNIAGDQILTKMRASEWGKNIPVYIISNLNEEDAPAGLRNLGIAGYSVKSNLKNDDIDKIVNSILKPGSTQAPPSPPQPLPTMPDAPQAPELPVTPPPQLG